MCVTCWISNAKAKASDPLHDEVFYEDGIPGQKGSRHAVLADIACDFLNYLVEGGDILCQKGQVSSRGSNQGESSESSE